MIASSGKIMKEIDKAMIEEMNIHCAYERYCGHFTLEDIFTTDSIYIAACHCASGFWKRKDTRAFMDSVWVNSRVLCQKVLEGKFKPSYYPKRTIVERGKPREIQPPKFECKVVQKTLCEYLIRSLLEPRMINTNFASVKGKGTEKLYQAVLKGVNEQTSNPFAVIVMSDFSGYFASISNEIMEQKLSRLIEDPRVTKLIRSFSPEEFGLSLGNELSQIPASYFPSEIDHYFKGYLRIHNYYRYMDDVLFLAPSDWHADWYIEKLKIKSAELKLVLKDEKIKKIPMGENFTFCKERYIFNKKDQYYYRLINPNIPRTEMRKLRAFQIKIKNKEMTPEEVTAQFRGVIGSIKGKPNTKKIVARLEEKYQKVIASAEPSGTENTTLQ